MRYALSRKSALLLLSAIGIIIAVWTLRVRDRDAAAALSQSMASMGYRTTEARLSGFAHVAWRGPSRGVRGDLDVAALAGRTIKKTADGRVRGVAALIGGDADQAVATLTALVAERPGDALLWNDLGAAHYERARIRGSVEELPTALAALHRALELRPFMPEAAFNRGLVLSALHLDTLAREAFRNGLADERDPGWGAESRRRVAGFDASTDPERWKKVEPKLQEACLAGRRDEANAIVSAFPQEARSWAEGMYVARWAEGDAQWLTVARCIGESLRQMSGERLLADAVAAIDENRSLAAAHLTYRKARVDYNKRRVAEAETLFATAREQFAAGGSPMELAVRYYQANVAYDRGDSPAALRLFDEVEASTPPSYRSLRAQIDWTRSVVLTAMGRTYEALETAQRSAAAFDALGERSNATQIRTSIAAILGLLGRRDEAWRVRVEVFRGASRAGNVEQPLSAAAGDEVSARRWDEAAALYRELSALPSRSPRWRAHVLLQRAFAVGRGTPDAGALSLARAAVFEIPDAALREDALDDLRFADAIQLRDADPRRAVELLSRTIERQAKAPNALRQARAFFERAKAHRGLGDDAAAAADLDSAIALLDQQSVSVEHDVRDHFFGAGGAAYDEAIDLHSSRGDHSRAFELAERSRARAVAARVAGDAPMATATLGEVATRVPRGAVMLHFTTLAKRSLVIVIRDGGYRAVSLPLGRDSIDGLVRAAAAAVERRDEASFDVQIRALSEALVAPLALHVGASEKIVVAADDSIAAVPFAALLAADEPLVARHAILMTPSATVYMRQPAASTPPRVAAVAGDPAFSPELFPRIPRLPGARDEAIRVAELYAGAVPLLDVEATKARFLALAAGADVLHLAGHAVDNEADPLLSVIPLAPEGGDAGLLYLRDVAAMKLPRHPVVVLAACRTATRSTGGRPIRSFALAFLAAGSRAVMGSLWNVDDVDTRTLALAFHRELRAGAAPSAALRDAQLRMIRSSHPSERSPIAWSGFQVWGNE